jgi:hypothetical protein
MKELTINHTVDSNGVSIFNVVSDTRFVITKMIGFLRVRIPADQNDKEFTREFMKLSVDVEKVLGGQANFLIKMIARMMLDSCDRKVEFPLAQVRSIVFASIANLLAHQGIYRFNNMTFTDNFIPDIYYIIRVQVLWDLRVVGRIRGGKKTVWFGNASGKVEFRPTDHSRERNATIDEFDEMIRLATRYLVRTQSWT